MLAKRLGLEVFATDTDIPGGSSSDDIALRADDDGLALCFLDGRIGPVRVSFDDPALRHRRRGGQNELLGRAVGWRANRFPRVLDATAGFGRDAFTLADLGCAVRLCERQPVMAALLEQAINEALGGDDWLSGAAQRMRLEPCDARELAPEVFGQIDVIYLDPMFSAPRRGLPSKEMQLLQVLTQDGACAPQEQAELLSWAREQPVGRVVVKRPRRAQPLGDVQPSHCLSGRSVRFDVYVNTAALQASE
jgi:16S rRNA (guanine1516-N2)-methyltransferase